MIIRPVENKDSRFLFELANDPVSRSASFNSERIAWQEHCQWFKEKMADAGSRIYIIENPKGHPVGQVRFDRLDGQSAQISVSLIPAERKKGLGTQALRIAVSSFFLEFPIPIIMAKIKPENAASIKSFQKAGFVRTGPDRDFPVPHVRMRFKRS